jgi:glycosyltransferase involved in cell wall biosynthesis
MRISLVVATVGRTEELRRLISSLEAQTHRDFEVIVVDQNADERLLPVLQDFAGRIDLRHVRLPGPPGASRARNLGIRYITGEVTGFPDDDCWYSEDFLRQVHSLFQQNPDWDAIIGEAVDEAGRPVLPWPDRSGPATRPVCWRRAVCFACILRTPALQAIGGFDETLGGGPTASWASGEDNDLMLRAINLGLHVRYERRVRIHHPRLFPTFDEAGRAKRYGYALGDGNLLRKHPMPMWWRLLFFGMPLGRMVLAMAKFAGDEARFHSATSVGRIKGYWQSA